MPRITGKDLFGEDLTEGTLLEKDRMIIKLPYIVEGIEHLKDGLVYKTYHEPSDIRGIGGSRLAAIKDFEKNYVDAYKAAKIKKIKDFEIKAAKKKKEKKPKDVNAVKEPIKSVKELKDAKEAKEKSTNNEKKA
jgi:hypothetical protein